MSAVGADTAVRLTVHYPAAAKPFKDDSASRNETVGELKVRVLSAFGLVEGTTPEGNIVTYPLYYDKAPLEDPGVRLGDLAGDKKVLQFKLAQQITQGQ